MVTSLADLDQDAVTANLAQAEQWVVELDDNVELRHGPVHDLLIYPHAILATVLQDQLTGYLSARSLQDIVASPTTADSATVDAILSNFRVTRRPAGAAAGQIVIVVSSPTTVVIASRAIFVAGGRNYVTTRAFVAKTEAEQVVGPGDRLLSAVTDGYAFTIDVTAETAGSGGAVRKNTTFIPAVAPSGFIKAYAGGDFSGGTDSETNEELILRLSRGIAARGPSNRVNMAAMLEDFVAYKALSIVGYGDPEMLRDKHTIFAIATGGRVDWYVRTAETALRSPLTITAVLVGFDTDGGGIWQFSLIRTAVPGFYEVRNIIPAGVDPTTVAGGYAVISDERVIDLSGDGFKPDIETLTEGVYSSYQASVIRFKAPSFGLLLGATADFDIEVVGLPLISDIQAYVSSLANRAEGSDCLVRAPIPCFVQVSLVVNVRTLGISPDISGIRNAIASAVNATGFTGRLFSSDLIEAASPYLSGGGISSFDLFGRIRYPDGTSRYLRAADVLTVPEDPGNCVSFRTVQFFSDTDDVVVSVVASVPEA